jgi:hypothetical protein
MKERYVVPGIAFLLFLIMVVEVGLSTRQQSPSWDEGDHIYSGYMNWKNGEYTLNPEHPPLVKLIATLPLLPLDLKIAPRHGRFFKSEAYIGGRELLFRNDPKYGGKYDADTLLFRVHMAATVFGLALAVLLFVAGREMFGASAGLIAMAIFVFDPTFLAHAPFVTTDTGAACGYFATVYLFYRFAKKMCWQRALACGVTLGLALTSKHSAIVLIPLLGILAIGELAGRWKAGRRFPMQDLRNTALGMSIVGAAGLFVVWGVYSFQFKMHPVGVTIPTMKEAVHTLSAPMQWFILTSAQLHVLPESYLYGLADVQSVGESWPTYFLGHIYAHGLWYYFPTALSIKWTVGTLALLALSLWVWGTGKIRLPRELFFFATPAAVYLAVAIASPLNVGQRHILPVFPFVFLLVGAAAAWLLKRSKPWIYVVGILLVAHAAESAHSFPDYLPFGNALWGGSSNTHRYLSDSAVDWGQQLKETKAWLVQHNVKQCTFVYFANPVLLASDYDIPCQVMPTSDNPEEVPVPPIVHGPLLISYSNLGGFEYGTWVRNPYETFNRRAPDDVIANGIAVYYGDYKIPEAEALAYIKQAHKNLQRDPGAALIAARTAVELVPNGFDANRTLGEVLAATGDKEGARAAYSIAASRVQEMEPSAQAHWKPIFERTLSSLTSASR